MGILERLQQAMPKHVKPIATNVDEHLAAMEKISQEKLKADNERNKQERIKFIMGRSGVSPLHQDCMFSNYVMSCEGQQKALSQARQYADNFGTGFGGFIFSGSFGTGKNHLAAAICNHLLTAGKTVFCITVPDLMMRFRETYSKNASISEAALLNELVSVDLLIIDEIGVQHSHSDNTLVLLNQIVDRRTSHKKPIGMLTNCGYEQMVNVIGMRIIDRMMMDGGLWVNFDWESYRSKVKTIAN